MHKTQSTIKPFALVGSGYDDPALYPIRPLKGGTGYAFRNKQAWLDGLEHLRNQKLKLLYEQAEALTKQIDWWEGAASRRWYEEQYGLPKDEQ